MKFYYRNLGRPCGIEPKLFLSYEEAQEGWAESLQGWSVENLEGIKELNHWVDKRIKAELYINGKITLDEYCK